MRAAEWLHHLGPPSRVTAIPGNHDAYVRLHPERGHASTGSLICSRTMPARLLVPTPPTLFPFVRRFGDVAIVALSSAVPTMPFVAAGKIGTLQRALARRGLGAARARRPVPRRADPPPSPSRSGELAPRASRCRHARRECSSRTAPSSCCTVTITEQTVHEIETVSGPAVVVGVPSASEAVEGRVPAARYNEYCIARNGQWLAASR